MSVLREDAARRLITRIQFSRRHAGTPMPDGPPVREACRAAVLPRTTLAENRNRLAVRESRPVPRMSHEHG